jgi:hypothetical protein
MKRIAAEMPPRSGLVNRPLGPYCKPQTLAKLDGRRKEAKLMQATREELHAFIGNKPTIVQQRLIDRAAVLALRLALIDARAPDGAMAEKTAREYLCWNNAYTRLLMALDATKTSPPPLTHAERLAQITAAVRSRPAPADDEDE